MGLLESLLTAQIVDDMTDTRSDKRCRVPRPGPRQHRHRIPRRAELQETLQTWVFLAEEKLGALQAQVAVAEAFVSGLHDDADFTRHTRS